MSLNNIAIAASHNCFNSISGTLDNMASNGIIQESQVKKKSPSPLPIWCQKKTLLHQMCMQHGLAARKGVNREHARKMRDTHFGWIPSIISTRLLAPYLIAYKQKKISRPATDQGCSASLLTRSATVLKFMLMHK